MKRSLITGAGIAVVALVGTGILASQKARKAEADWRADIQARGIKSEIASPLRWQLWPLGLKGGAISLATGQGGKLLDSPAVFLSLGPADLFSNKSGILQLQDAAFHYQQNADGSSNWDSFLRNSGASRLRGLTLENATLEISTANTSDPVSVSLPQLQWQSDKQSLQTSFMISSQDESRNNLLVEGSLQTRILPQGQNGWQLKSTVLDTTVSSTRLPGTLVFRSSGDIRLQARTLSSEALNINAAFKAPGQTQDVAVDILASLQLDWQAGLLQLPALTIKTGKQEWQLKGDMVANRSDMSLQAGRISVTRKADGSSAAQGLDINGLSLKTTADNKSRLFHLGGKIGEGSFDLPVTTRLGVDSAKIAVTLTMNNIDIRNLRSWLNDGEASGLLTLAGNASTEGHSLSELEEKASGQLSLKLGNAQFGEVSIMPALRERLQGYASLLPALAENTAPEKGTRIRELQLQAKLGNGVFNTEKFLADIELARLDASGSYDRRKGLMDYHGKLVLDHRLFATAGNLDLPIVCQGNLHEEQVDFVGGLETDCKVDEKAKQDLLARALINRFRN